MVVNRAKRDETIIALGGGVVGDLAGFVASTYNRGMNFVQAPTSVAAMMDASIGGKTAVDLKQGKNLVGAFHQPLMVIADVSTLVTLPRREAVEGWAEGIKHGLILDPGLFEIFESEKESLLELDHVVTTDVIKRSMGIKARIVSLDERETLGYRTLLNYGHTLGHALETATEYGVLLHGEAVAIGMMAAAKIGNRLGITPDTLVERQERVLRSFDLPISIPKVDMEIVNDAMALDKKAEGSRLRWVLLKDLGQAVVRDDVPDTLIRDVLSSMLR
ncbi:3-dehydroquinate synthase [SAR202 cluster bacterium AD-493-K16_JPT_193m]|nr:3-dehydroquinate synthase [SAR202 cluster bacterium AD-493-K16_JPT_193m]